MRGRRVVLGLGAALLVLTGCTPEPAVPRETSIDVDTPALREQKAQAGIEDCAPGAASGANELPALTLPCLGGGSDVDLSSLEGPVLVNLWFSACGPCRTEMPVLEQFHQRYGDQVPVLGVDIVDTAPVAALGLMRDTGATYPSLADPSGALQEQPDLPLARGYPQFLLVQADGTLAGDRGAGGVDDLDELVDYVERGLGTTL